MKTPTVDAAAQQRFAELGLELRAIAPDDEATQKQLYFAIGRGFNDANPSEGGLQFHLNAAKHRDTKAVYDPASSHTTTPVGTIASWQAPLTVPGGTVDFRAISLLTVAGTHRRRGIARTLFESELRTAAESGVAVAGLTATEGSIYGRFGFAPATYKTTYRIDTRRAGWKPSIPVPAGQLHYATPNELAEYLAACIQRTVPNTPGSYPPARCLTDRMAGTTGARKDAADTLGVTYIDNNGQVRGAMAYSIDTSADWERAELQIHVLLADTEDAVCALWEFALNHDLVGTVEWSSAPCNAGIDWCLNDQRGLSISVEDSHWLRVLDTPAALTSRRYAAPLDMILTVEDPYGYAAGTWRFTTVETTDDDPVLGYRAELTETTADDTSAPRLVLNVNALSGILLGGQSTRGAHLAGELIADDALRARVDAAFASPHTPYLLFGY